MKDEAFKELCEAVREGGRILRGEQKPSRRFSVDDSFVRRARQSLRLSQAEFAAMLNVPTATLRNWEQGRCVPDGPARALLVVAARRPDAVYEALHEASVRGTRRIRARKAS
jgi:putative transcriptional regulator